MANLRSTFFALPFIVLMNGMAFAGDAPTTLELYPTDASDECVEGTTQIRVNVIGVKAKGIMKLELYNSDKGFLRKKGRLRPIRDAAQDGPMRMCINVPEPGIYAVAGYHDVDGNRKLKQKWDFTPREPYGLSNNPQIKERRMPGFDEAAFEVGPQGTDIDFVLVDLKAEKKARKAAKKAAKSAGDND
ncbi:MAG: DUF2141 domain-containing protein [Maricaulaceae bacterium]